jgi:hypothetical protein
MVCFGLELYFFPLDHSSIYRFDRLISQVWLHTLPYRLSNECLVGNVSARVGFHRIMRWKLGDRVDDYQIVHDRSTSTSPLIPSIIAIDYLDRISRSPYVFNKSPEPFQSM